MSPAHVAVIAGLSLTSCMLAPENGENVEVDGMVSFWGQGTSPGQVFDVQSASR